MILGKVYRLNAEPEAVSKNGKTYMQLRAREKTATEVRQPPSPRPSSRSDALGWALREVEAKYGRK